VLVSCLHIYSKSLCVRLSVCSIAKIRSHLRNIPTGIEILAIENKTQKLQIFNKRVPSSSECRNKPPQYRKKVPSSPKLLIKSVSRFAHLLFLVCSSWTVFFFLWIYFGMYVTCTSTCDMKIEETRSSKLYASVSWSNFGKKKLPILIASNENPFVLLGSLSFWKI